MPRLLVVHHTPSPALHSLLTAVLDGVADPALADVEVVTDRRSSRRRPTCSKPMAWWSAAR